jgi:ubiquinone/menaquinone biosynthesis C-methylase UbiE
MPIDFHAERNRYTYTTRQADASWIAAINGIVNVRGKRVADIGCGGGIYCKALVEMGAASVMGIDFSEEIVKGARENCRDYEAIQCIVGNALSTGLPDEQFDVIVERALIHHLKEADLPACFAEARRILKAHGTLIVQDRTPEDCLLPGSPTNIRGYFFARYPKLVEREIARRRESVVVREAFQRAGFQQCREEQLWETRAIYPDRDALANDLLMRTGRSILHELTDEELSELVAYIGRQLDGQGEIVERDRWTLWIGVKE